VDVIDRELARRVKGGELAAFSSLIRLHAQRTFRIVRSILGDDGDAEDACLDTWLQVHAELSRWPDGLEFSTWVGRIALRVALARLPEHRGLASLHGLDRDAPDVGDPEADGRAGEAETVTLAMEQAIDAMRPSYSTVVVLRYVESLTTRETAAILGLGEENVQERLTRARAWLREQLGDEIGVELREVFRLSAERSDRLVGAVMRGLFSAARPMRTAARSGASRPRFAGAGRGRSRAQTDRAWSPLTISNQASRSTRRRTNSS
jgi:RNA polymerase sigma-70 factor (ECF subfamily)